MLSLDGVVLFPLWWFWCCVWCEEVSGRMVLVPVVFVVIQVVGSIVRYEGFKWCVCRVVGVVGNCM